MANRTAPFPRGATFGAATTADLQYVIGAEYDFPDVSPSTGVKRSAKTVRCRAVQNLSGAAMLPKRLARTQAGKVGYSDGYTRVEGEQGFPIDEYLPSAGVASLDIFWVVVEGPAIVKTDLAGFTALTVGDTLVPPSRLYAQTAATMGATTAGRVIMAAGTTASQNTNFLGPAMSACTSQGYDVDILCNVTRY